ncbi:MAG: response regulator transcription factor [Vicinamibacterales bacterium]
MKQTASPEHRPAPHVLVVEDEPHMQMLLADSLEFEGYRVTAVPSGERALAVIGGSDCSLVILDVMLSGISGLEVCRQLRAQELQVPIIMLTARGEEADRIAGLELGADDYVTKPFSVRELMARVRAHLRRRGNHEREASNGVSFGDVVIDLRRRTVLRAGQRLKLTSREFELLHYLVRHRGETISREELLRNVWGYGDETVTRTVDNYIAKLRSLLEPSPHEPQYIVTVHGSGYRMSI